MRILQYSVIFTATLNFNLAAVVIIFILSNSSSLPVNFVHSNLYSPDHLTLFAPRHQIVAY